MSVNLNVQDPTGQPDDVNGIGGMGPGGEFDQGGPIPPDTSAMGGGLILPDLFVKGILSAPFNVAHAVWGKDCPPLSDAELNSGILPIQTWIQESTAGMAIEKPGQMMAILWLGSMALPRAISVISAKDKKNPKKGENKADTSTGTADQTDQELEVLSLGDGIYVEPELR